MRTDSLWVGIPCRGREAPQRTLPECTPFAARRWYDHTAMRPFICVLSAALLASSSARAQRVITLMTPDAEYAEPFSVVSISGVRPLKDGRVIVSDSKEKTVQLVDFKAAPKPIGRLGSGPNEYLNPSGLAALPGDTTALWDGGNRRFMLIRPDGSPGGELSPAATNYGAFAPMLPRGTDARGAIFIQGSPFIQTANGPAAADTVPVLRYDRSRDLVDTVAFLRPQTGNAVVGPSPNGTGASITNGLANPLVPQDDWVALPNGLVAVVRGIGYHVDFYDKRKVVSSGPAVTWQPTPVDGEIKREIIDQRRRQLQNLTPRSRPTGQVSTIPPGAAERMLAALEPWPAMVPPFMRGAAIVRTNGIASQIWVRRTSIKDTDRPTYDVFDEGGRVIARVQMPARTQVVGFGPQVVYAIRTDDDDLQYLQRYKLPSF